MNKMRFPISLRLFLGFGIFILVLLVALYFVQITLSKAEKVNNQMNNVHMPSLTACRNLLLSVEESMELSKQWAFVQRSDDHIEKRKFNELVDQTIPSELAIIDSLQPFWIDEQKQECIWIHQEWDTLKLYYTTLRQTLNSFDSYQDPFKIITAEDLFLEGKGIPKKIKRLQYLIKDQLNHFHTQITEERALMNQSFEDLYILLASLSVLIILLGFVIGYVTSRTITTRIRKIRRILKKLSFGVYDNQQLQFANDEIGDMGIAVEKLIGNFEKTKDFASEVGKGNFDTEFTPLSEKDEMGQALIQMKSDLFAYRNQMEEKVSEQTQELVQQKNQSDLQREEIERLYGDLKSSITYAKRLQDSILPSASTIQKILPQHFILFLPKDVVSGDFYWVQDQGNKKLFAAADCTGHGVPGAFMSLIAHNALNHVSKVYTVPGQILNQVNRIASSAFHSEENEQIKDGMDIALCSLDTTTLNIEFSGAQNALYIIRNAELIEINAEKRSIGIESKEHRLFSTHTYQCERGDMLYLFSDGYADQFGGPKNKKFMRKQLKEVLMKNAHLEMNEQKHLLAQVLEDWKKDEEQTDDILIMGVRV
jgi:serine phosphatase RsbU (regulator of sigma subunit)/HAMP domain-containing protein